MSFFDECAGRLNDPQRQAQQFDQYYEQRVVLTVLRNTQRLDLEQPLRRLASEQYRDRQLRLSLLAQLWPEFPLRLVADRCFTQPLESSPQMLFGALFSDFTATPLYAAFLRAQDALAAEGVSPESLGVVVPCKGVRGGLLIHGASLPPRPGLVWRYQRDAGVWYVEALSAFCQWFSSLKR